MRSWTSSTVSSCLGPTLGLCLALACGDDGATGGGADASTGGTDAGAGGGSAGGGAAGQGGVAGTGGAPQSGTPHIGVHGLSYFRYGENTLASIETPALATQPSGSTIIASAGRGDFAAFAPPTDNKGNQPFTQLGAAHTYTNWPTSGTALYSFVGAVGGPNHIISNTNVPGDEITFAVVEVTGSSHVQDSQWVERLNDGQPVTSAAVTTTAPATLVAFWWGDGGADDDKVAVPNNGFVVLDSIGLSGSLVQCFVAAKEVETAGTYEVTWDATPAQGAQLWLVAVQ